MIAAVKLWSMRFVRKMFRDRGYQADDASIKTYFDDRQNVWQIHTRTSHGDKVVAIFADCRSFGQDEVVPMNDVNVIRIDGRESKDSLTIPSGNCNSTNKNMGTDYIKCIVKFATEHNFKVIILVTDFMTSQASKLMLKVDGLRMTHFTYDETGIEHMADHITQPVMFKALDKKQRQDFIQKNPHYQKELIRYSFDDALVKYYGMIIGDIIFIQDNDRQSALVEEYGLVVEEIT
jgi:hypothetical protein